MPTDNRLKYIDSQIAELGSQDSVDKVIDGGPYDVMTEGFEGGVHLGRARVMFLVFAAMIMILYVLED